MGAVAIAGVAESALGDTGRPALDLQVEAALGALGDAGLTLADVDGLAANGPAPFAAASIAEELGLAPSWCDGTMAGGASWEMYIGRAVSAIQAGLCTTALLVYGSNQRSARSRRLGGAFERPDAAAAFQLPYAPLVPISYYALAATRHHHEYGTTPEQLAEVAVAARAWSQRNPVAYRFGAGPLTVDDVLGSPIVSSPLHGLDCCLVTDGGGAAVVTSLERARHLPAAPVVVLGHGEVTTHGWSMTATEDLTVTGAAASGRRAFAGAGVGPGDIDVAQIYDSFTITVLLTLEALGFCAAGEGGSFVADGRTRPGGAFPLNTSGGGLSYCHPGQLGVFLVIEAVRQLRGEAAGRQVPGAEVALCHGTGGILSTHATTILGIDR